MSEAAAEAKAETKFDPTKTELTNHPLADIFPLMKGLAFDALVEDIKANWLREPITLYEGKILDGRNRYRAIVKADLRHKLKEENFRQFDPKTQGDPLAFVISANLHRRHLTESQRATIAANLVTTKLGQNQYNRYGVTNKQAATLLGVSEALVEIAKKVEKNAAPEIKEKLLKGELRLGMAKDIVKKSKGEQQAELDRIKKQQADDKQAAKAKREAAKATGAKSKVSEANQDYAEFEDFKKKWKGFNAVTRRSFVVAFKADIAKVLAEVQQQEEMIGGGSLNLGTQTDQQDAA
jgi:hypothetical protein